MVSAFDRVAELLKKSADDAPIGSVVVEILCFVRLMGDGVLLVWRRVSCGGGRLVAWWAIVGRLDCDTAILVW